MRSNFLLNANATPQLMRALSPFSIGTAERAQLATEMTDFYEINHSLSQRARFT